MSDKQAQLEHIVGTEHVYEKPEYGESYALGQIPKLMPAPDFLVRPANTNQVLEIVKWANKTGTALIPVSSSPPHYGSDTKPLTPGSVVVDLSRMNNIVRIDRRNRLALIEPGVSWGELQAELKKHGMRAIAPLLPKKGKSVIASLLEREPCTSPKFQWNMNEPLRALEIVWGSGDRLYSGSGAFRGETDEDWEKGRIPVTAPGPNQFDFIKMVTAAQGTMGIVTWASVKCELYPEAEKTFLIQSDNLQDLVSFSQKALRYRFGDDFFILNRSAASWILGDGKATIQSMKDNLSPWLLFITIKGGQLRAKEKVAFQEADLKEMALENGLHMVSSIGGLSEHMLRDTCISYTGGNNWKLKNSGGAQEIFFLSTLDKIQILIDRSAELVSKQGCSFSDFGIYLQPLQQGVSVHCHIVIPVDRDNAREGDRVNTLFSSLSRDLHGQGAFFSRPYGIWAEMIYEEHTQHTEITKKMKNIFDPNHILNPGKLCF